MIRETSHVTLLMNPDEEDEVTQVGIEMARYIQMVSSAKFAGVAYTKAFIAGLVESIICVLAAILAITGLINARMLDGASI